MKHISLAHGNGGYYMRQLIENLFVKYLHNPLLKIDTDAACLPPLEGELMMSVDGFTVHPLEFPGGNIGSLAIHGTVNDLAVSGAVAKYLSLSLIIEEGFEIECLDRIVRAMADAANDAGVAIVCGDTKVVARGEASGLYISTTGIGIKQASANLSIHNIAKGDVLLVSGPVGDHGSAIMLAREQFGLRGDLQSDAASVLPLCQALYDQPGLHFMRDPTRGGLATVLNEITRATGLGVRVYEENIPLRDEVSGICDILGYDPLYLACEGRIVIVVARAGADDLLQVLKQVAPQAVIIGEIIQQPSRVILQTVTGGERVLEELEDEPLPRIC
ncbi:MAG: hydrogenase expression/formation protein HypE [Gammaproteobacteria bacterium]|nr:hydrogenase expression/formation protein HypE [Gammaproteobacteria bacterium]